MTARELLASPPTGTDILVSAPGRANLMGDHTDGDEGYVLPVAERLASDTGFVIDDARLDFYGRCAACATRDMMEDAARLS
jgi:hypothetical protein